MLKRVLLIICLACLGCGETATNRTDEVVTESDLVRDPSRLLSPGAVSLVAHLETPSEEASVDLAGLGFDDFGFLYPSSTTQTFCWKGGDGSEHTLCLEASNGEELLEVSANEGCASAEVPAGEVRWILTHDGIDPSGRGVFIVPVGASAYDLRIDECRDCNLSSGNFQGLNLGGTDFTGADLRDADFRGVNLLGATLAEANLSRARFSVALLAQSSIAEPVPQPGAETEAERLLSARHWAYSFDWVMNLNGDDTDPDVLTLLRSESDTSEVIAVFELSHTVGESLHTLTLERASGDVSAERVDYLLSDCTDSIPVTSTAIEPSRREYQFALDGSDDEALCHRLVVSGFDVFQLDQVTVRYERSADTAVQFDDFVSARVDRDDAFALERIDEESGAPRTLQAHLESFFGTLFLDEARPHGAQVTVVGLLRIADGLPPTEIPLLLATLGSTELEDGVPALAEGIKDALVMKPEFEGLVFRVGASSERQVASLTLSNATLALSAVSDL